VQQSLQGIISKQDWTRKEEQLGAQKLIWRELLVMREFVTRILGNKAILEKLQHYSGVLKLFLKYKEYKNNMMMI